MSILAGYHTEDALLVALKERGVKKSRRTLQIMRQQRLGPPWTKIGNTVLYPDDGFIAWLKTQTQQPVRSRRTA
jgi:ABC-type nitrate/sulfonate/bicarbonate transport system ATPase subunit